MDGPSTDNEESQQWPQYMATISSILLAVSAGLHSGWPSMAQYRWEDLDFHVGKEEEMYITIMGPLGYFIGCPVTAYLLDKVGRKLPILLLAGPQILAWLLIANCTSVYMIWVARLIAGFSEGGTLTSVPIYIGEISHPFIRGALGVSYEVAIMVGSLLINIYGSLLSITISAYVSIFVPVLFLITFVWMPESPYFCVMKNKNDKSRRSLQNLRKLNDVEQGVNQLISIVQKQNSESNRIKSIFTVRRNLKAFLVLLGVRTVQQFATGNNNFYDVFILKRSYSVISFLTIMFVFHISSIMVGCCTSMIIDCSGRKLLLKISLIGTSVSLFLMAVCVHLQYLKYDLPIETWLPLALMVLCTMMRTLGLTTIPTLLLGELFSINIKAKAVCLVNVYFALCITLIFIICEKLKEKEELHHVTIYGSSLACIAGIWLLHFLPETNQKTLDEIQQELKGNATDQPGSAAT